ncbi:MAG TPA: response regulator transcription factor [Bdellovibrionota bacterium]|jgi:two-component system phosphate regulon response regulator PhoB
MKHARVLVVEDESDIRELIVMHLTREGHKVEACGDGKEAMDYVERGAYDLLVLDWMLPEKSGLEILREVRKKTGHEQVAVLMVTARGANSDLVLGLESGADDYLVKPFELSVLMARARALLRRLDRKEAALSLGALQIDEAAHEARLDGKAISLTPYEFKLLVTLAQNQGRVLTRDQLIREVQGGGVSVVERAIDTHVFGLRKKLGSCADLIETVRGVGYRIAQKA